MTATRIKQPYPAHRKVRENLKNCLESAYGDGPGHSDLDSPFCLVGRPNRSMIYSPAFSRAGVPTVRLRVLGAFTGSASDSEC